MSTAQVMTLENTKDNSATQNSGGAIDSLASLSLALGSGVSYKTVIAIAASMDAVQNTVRYYTDQVGSLMEESVDFMNWMKDQSDPEVSSTSDYEDLSKQSSMNWSITQAISSAVTEYASYLSQDGSILTGLKSLGNAVINMYSNTSKVR